MDADSFEADWEVDSEANLDTKGKVVMKTGTVAVIKTFKKLKAKNKKQCMDKCKKTKNCKVFNFRQKKKQCLLQTIGLKKDKKSKGKVTGIMPCPTTTSNPPVTVKPVTTMKPATTMKPVTVIPPVSSCSCGKPNRKMKIVNGVETEANEYPWQIGLTFGGTGYYASCGGSIIGKKSILTAAHCTAGKSPGDIYVMVGVHNQNSATASNYKTVCGIHDHQDYNSGTTDYDFSVLTLCMELTYSKEVQPVCLPSKEDDGTQYESLTHVVSGWGTTSSGGSISHSLLETNVVTMSNSMCCSTPYSYACSQITTSMMCAAAASTDSCQGDSGGPLVTKDMNTGRYVQTGVVSWGNGCALAQYPGVYARVSKVMNWIKSKMMLGGDTPCSTGTTGPTVAPTIAPTVAPTIAPTIAPTSCDCGNANKMSKIVNGVETLANEYPWQVGLTSSSQYYTVCGGAIISKKDILTAAHCVPGKAPGDLVVLVGAHNQNQASASDYKTVCAIHSHADYNSTTYDNDIAILTLCSELTFSQKVAPVCTPSVQSSGTIYEGLDHVVSGWGATSSGGASSPTALLETTVKTMSNVMCTTTPYDYSSSAITSNMMCAANPGTDSCQGDSGGPLVTKDITTGKYTQTGVVSFGIGCAQANYPGVYARVTQYVDWMASKASGDICKA